jgi:hypothetical protein
MSVLPNRGLVGGAVMLLLLVPMFLMISQEPDYKGIYVRLVPPRGRELDEYCLVGPIVVTVKGDYKSSTMLLDGKEVSREELAGCGKTRDSEYNEASPATHGGRGPTPLSHTG